MRSHAMSPRAPMPCCCSIAPDGIRQASSTCPKTSRRSSCLHAPVQSGRERLAVSPSELALEHRLRKLQRHHRRRMRRLTETGRPARTDHLYRNARLGPRRSAVITFGSLHEAAASSGLCVVTLQPGPHRWFFSTSGRGRRQQSGATLALTLRAAQCIKRRLYLQPKVARHPHGSAPAALPRDGTLDLF